MKAQIEAYKAAIEWKYGELGQWEAIGTRKQQISSTEADAYRAAEARARAGKKLLDEANGRITALEREIRTEDRCEKCKLVPGEFKWSNQ